MKKPILPLVLIVGASLGIGSCGNNVQGNDATPVYLTVNIGGQGAALPLAKNVADNSPLQLAQVIVTNQPKNPNVITSPLMDVILEDYVVSWTRIDGGKTASPPERFTAFGLTPVGGESNLQNFPFMTDLSLQKPPLNSLFPFNGGIDPETNSTEIRQAMTVIFRGHTVSGQAVTSTPGVFSLFFVYQAPGVVRVRMDK